MVASPIEMPTKCDSEPLPGAEPNTALPPWARAQSVSCWMSLAPVVGVWVAIATSKYDTPAIGVKSATGS